MSGRGYYGGLADSPGGNRGGFSSPRGRGDFSSPSGRGGYSTPRGRGAFSSPRGGYSPASPGAFGSGGFRGGRGGRGRDVGGGSYVDPNIPMPELARHRNLVQQQLAPGTEGRPVELVANFYKLNTTEMDVQHYKLTIDKNIPGSNLPPKPKDNTSPTDSSHSSDSSSHPFDSSSHSSDSSNIDRFVKKFGSQVVEKLVADNEVFQNVSFAFDGVENFYTSKQLDLKDRKHLNFAVQIQIDNRPADFKITLKWVNRVVLSEVIEYYQKRKSDLSGRSVSVCETVFRFIMGKEYAQFQRKFYDMNTIHGHPRVELAEFVSGFTSAVRMTEFGLALNLHLKTSCVISRQIEKLTDVYAMIGNISPGARPNVDQILQVSRFIRHLRMFTKHSKNEVTYTMDGIVDKLPSQYRFTDRDGLTMSIAEYFKKEYNLELQNLPLIKTTGKQRFLPMELCFLVPNQFLSNAKINTQIQRELLFKSTHTPNVLFNKLDTVVKKVATTRPETQQAFGISLETKPAAFTGRVLPTPRQLCADGRGKFHSTKPAPAKWGVFCFDPTITQEALNTFVKAMADRARYFGLTFGQPNPVAIVAIDDAKKIHNIFCNVQQRTHAEFLFVGIPAGPQNKIAPAQIYGLTKFFCDQKFGIVTQCFKSEYINRMPAGYFDNFLLKVNGKIGGQNAIIDPALLKTMPFNMDKTMMIGVDVTHNIEVEPVSNASIAAAVGSVDNQFSDYTCSIRVLPGDDKAKEVLKEEMIQMFRELLVEYKKKNHFFPETMVVYRDGVSEGEFKRVKDIEIPCIVAAINYENKESGPETKLVVITTLKRHNTRFALTVLNQSGRKPTWNVPSGTVVDNAIVEPLYKMFYLNSHFSPLGTSRPTKYVILRDDLNMNADTVQKLCFFSCYNSVRTRNVIAIPTPVRYADLAAYRAKVFIEAQRDEIHAKSSQFDSKISKIEDIIKKLNDMVKVNNDLKNRLYYC